MRWKTNGKFKELKFRNVGNLKRTEFKYGQIWKKIKFNASKIKNLYTVNKTTLIKKDSICLKIYRLSTANKLWKTKYHSEIFKKMGVFDK